MEHSQFTLKIRLCDSVFQIQLMCLCENAHAIVSSKKCDDVEDESFFSRM